MTWAEPPEPTALPPRGVTVELTPALAFAAGALLVSALGLAFVVGQRNAPSAEAPTKPKPGAARTLEEVRTLPPIRYEALPVDLGTSE